MLNIGTTGVIYVATSPQDGRKGTVPTVNEVLVAYLDHADRYYRGLDGKPADETRHAMTVGRVVREMYGHALAKDFGPLALKAVRQQFVARGWCRTTVNRQTDRRPCGSWAFGL